MKDVRGVEVAVGDEIVIANRSGNIAEFKFGRLHEVDEQSLVFKMVKEDGKISSWMNWYFLGYAVQHRCKVLRLGP